MAENSTSETKKESSGNSDNSPGDEVTDADRETAQQAFTQFFKKNYGASISSLNKLSSSRPSDLKVSIFFSQIKIALKWVIPYLLLVVLTNYVWRPLSLSELNPMILDMGLTCLGSEASIIYTKFSFFLISFTLN